MASVTDSAEVNLVLGEFTKMPVHDHYIDGCENTPLVLGTYIK